MLPSSLARLAALGALLLPLAAPVARCAADAPIPSPTPALSPRETARKVMEPIVDIFSKEPDGPSRAFSLRARLVESTNQPPELQGSELVFRCQPPDKVIFQFAALGTTALASPVSPGSPLSRPKNLGSPLGETTSDTDTRADYLLGPGVPYTEDVRDEPVYFAAMDRLGPAVVPILIKRYQEVPKVVGLRAFKERIGGVLIDAVLHYQDNSKYPLGAVRREQALRFFCGLITSGDGFDTRGGIYALDEFTKRFPVPEPYVTEALLQMLEKGSVNEPIIATGMEILARINHDEATARRMEAVINTRLLPYPPPPESHDDTLERSRRAVQAVRGQAKAAAQPGQ